MLCCPLRYRVLREAPGTLNYTIGITNHHIRAESIARHATTHIAVAVDDVDWSRTDGIRDSPAFTRPVKLCHTNTLHSSRQYDFKNGQRRGVLQTRTGGAGAA